MHTKIETPNYRNQSERPENAQKPASDSWAKDVSDFAGRNKATLTGAAAGLAAAASGGTSLLAPLAFAGIGKLVDAFARKRSREEAPDSNPGPKTPERPQTPLVNSTQEEKLLSAVKQANTPEQRDQALKDVKAHASTLGPVMRRSFLNAANNVDKPNS